MISLSNSLNRVQIISVILLIKLSEAPPFHSHPELVSPDLSSETQSLSVPCSPWLGITHTQWLADIKLRPRALSPAINSLTLRPLDISTWMGHKLPRSSMSKTNSSGTCLCTLGLMDGCVLWNQVRKLVLNNPLHLHSSWPSSIFSPALSLFLYFLTHLDNLIRNSEVILHHHPHSIDY